MLALLAAAALAVPVPVTGTDSRFTVAKVKLSAGAVTFRVANRGRAPHVFSVRGRSVTVRPGRTAALTVTLPAGPATLTWRTKAGPLRAILTIPAAVATTTTTTTTAVEGTPVQVAMFEYGYRMPSTIQAGRITFRLTNTGRGPHDFRIEGVAGSPIIPAGGTGTLTVQLAPGTYTYLCTVRGHAAQGMTGTLTVT